MPKRYITMNPDNSLGIITINGVDSDGRKLTRALFAFSRTIDMDTHFDAAIHTLETIAAGIEGHRALAVIGECEDTDLPTDRYFRNAWEWSD